MANIIDEIEREQLRSDAPRFRAGDTVRVHAKVIEGGKERIQVFEGVVIAMKQGATRTSFTVRKISHTVGVERTFLLHSPKIAKIEVTRRGKVRRAKLYYLRTKVGRHARIKELRDDRSAKGANKAAGVAYGGSAIAPTGTVEADSHENQAEADAAVNQAVNEGEAAPPVENQENRDATE